MDQKPALRFAWVLLPLALAGACGSESPSRVPGTEAATSATPQVTQVSTIPKPAFGGHAEVRAPIEAVVVSRLIDDPGTSDHVRRVVEDGVITFAEYEASVYGFLACMEEHGFSWRPDDPRLSVRGVYRWRVGRPADPNVVTEADRLARASEGYTLLLSCESEALGGGGLIDLAWKQAVGPTEQELQAAMDELAVCLKEGGLGSLVPESPSYEYFAHQRPAFLSSADAGIQAIFFQCARRVQDDWGLIGFVLD